METWKPIEEFPDYEISDQGNVMSNKRRKTIIIRPVLSRRGYLSIVTSHYGKKRMLKIHQLVLKHFGPPQPLNTTPDHINRIKTDNRIENLRWATPEEQNENRIPAKGETHGSCKLTEDQALEIKRRLQKPVNQAALSREYGISRQLIAGIKSGRKWAYLNI